MTSLPTLDAWRAIDDRARRAHAEALARQLPTGFALVDVVGEVATFAHTGRRFAFVPGGEVMLGWDPTGWEATAEEQASYAESAAEHGLEPDLATYQVGVTRRRHGAVIAPLLVETTASDPCWTAATDELALREAHRHLPADPDATSTVTRGGTTVRLHRTAAGELIAEQQRADTSHAALAAAVAAEGFGLLTSDEWEHACGGGATTLFRWSDHAPCDRYPTDTRAAPPFEHHRVPNRFGLHIAFDPYHFEVVAEADRTRGGDGGGSSCGGEAIPLAWLPLATAYFDELVCLRDPAAPHEGGYTVLRRALRLG